MRTANSEPFAAIILSGGSGRRLGGRDKGSLDVSGATLLERVRAAVSDATHIVVVGLEVQGGPVAALGAGLKQVTTPLVATLAVDQPLIGGALAPLRSALAGHDVAVLTRGGRCQHLAAIWQRDSLAAALARLDQLADAPMHKLFDNVRVAEVDDEGDWSLDLDTPADLEAIRRRLSEAQQQG